MTKYLRIPKFLTIKVTLLANEFIWKLYFKLNRRLETLREIKSHFINWPSVAYKRWTNQFPFSAVLRSNHETILFKSIGEYFAFTLASNCAGRIRNAFFDDADNALRFDYRDRHLRFAGVKSSESVFGNGDFSIFCDETYGDLDVQGKMVLDIGANIGDSAIYFALQGAVRVIALEPFPRIFSYLKQNIEANGLSSTITPLNAGISCRDMAIKVSSESLTDTGSQLTLEDDPLKGGVSVLTYSLKTLSQSFGLKDAALKMDCEGCEYDAVLNSDTDTLRKFSQIYIEYHYGGKKLTSKLEECGFQVVCSETTKFYNFGSTNKAVYLLGHLTASRRVG